MAAGMTDAPERDDLELDLPEPQAPAAGGSILDRLAQAREEVAEEQTTELELPNNGGLLWATYRLLPWRKVKQYAEASAQSKSPTKELQIAADMIAEATVEVWLRGEDGRRVPWPTGDEHVTHGPRLLELLRVPALPAGAKRRDYVRVVLAPPATSGEPRELAVTSHHQELVEWMEKGHAAVSRDYAEG